MTIKSESRTYFIQESLEHRDRLFLAQFFAKYPKAIQVYLYVILDLLVIIYHVSNNYLGIIYLITVA